MIQAVLLDLDATLLDYGMPAWRATVRAVCDVLVRSAPDLDADSLHGAYTRRYLDHMRAGGDGAQHPPGRIPDADAIWRSAGGRHSTSAGTPDSPVLRPMNTSGSVVGATSCSTTWRTR